MQLDTSLLVLASTAFLAATILPISSEVVLAVIIATTPDALWLPILVATAGNTAGAVVNWALGRFFIQYRDRRWFPVPEHQLVKASRWFQRYGVWSLLFAWLPVVGDPLTLAAGLLRVPFWTFLPLVAIGKGARYGVLAWTVLAGTS